MTRQATVSIIGATGLVGRQMIEALAERQFPLSNLQLYASVRSAGEEIACGSLTGRVELLETAKFAGTDIVLMAAGAQVSAEWAGRAAESGALVIDTSQLFVDDPEVPLVVAELNPDALVDARNRGIVTSPNAVAVAASTVLQPLQLTTSIRRVVITTFEPVSGAGRAGVEELQRQTLNLMSGQSSENQVFPQRIAFNVIPQLGDFLAGGSTQEEAATITAIGRLLEAAGLPISVTRVRVPTFYGSALAVNVETETPLTADDVRETLAAAAGLQLAEDLELHAYPTPADTIDNDAIYVGRVRCDTDVSVTDLWIALDSIRKGAAVNTIQIAEILLRDYL